MVDMFPGRSASIMASNNLVRCLFGAGATVLIDPALQALGVGWVNRLYLKYLVNLKQNANCNDFFKGFTVISLVLLPSRLLVLPLLKWGPTWRQQRLVKQNAEAATGGN